MIKGIVLFDIKDFLYQGLDKHDPDIELINKKQVETLDILHREMMKERDRRMNSNIPVPIVDVFLPTGDGYYFLCSPALSTILDISLCIKAMLYANGITGYCVAHRGDVNIFMDMTGKENATGFELGYVARLQSVCKETDDLICSKNLCDIWKENDFFELNPAWDEAKAKDDVKYVWKRAEPKDFENACGKFQNNNTDANKT